MDSRFNDTVHSLRYTDEKSDDEYAFVKALRMSGGVGANSYSANSLLQSFINGQTSLEEMMMNLNFPNYIKVAELGCSSGQNTFLAISEIINTINVLCQNSNQNPPEIDCCLNDLPENDFNTFKFVPFFNKEIMMTNQASCFVPFYSRLFSRNSLHFIHSSYALHWLSKVPENLENNKENAYISNSSPQSAYKAYLNQFQRDFSMFLTLRSEEIVSNGRMVLTFIGRNTLNSDQFYRDCCHIWTLLSKSLVSKPKLDAFNMPFYDPNEQELKEVIQNEGSFEINDLETHGFDLGHNLLSFLFQLINSKTCPSCDDMMLVLENGLLFISYSNTSYITASEKKRTKCIPQVSKPSSLLASMRCNNCLLLGSPFSSLGPEFEAETNLSRDSLRSLSEFCVPHDIEAYVRGMEYADSSDFNFVI
ncbi:hypothetical protein HID58_068504 [Brassica napus]|uniref:Uncharacterized protein n=1 Tax=Brassica napus TaxID=3708 RepID=A0ABQ7ZM69_BRANA|nr:hypothetical protein HID58_068504 [Brassica napus]